MATIRDRTEIESLGSELETMHTLSDALRAQTHEHANRLHTIVSLMELGRTPEALDFATKDLELSQRLTDDIVSSIEEPVLGALIMGKAAEAHERGVELIVNAGGSTAVTGLAVQDLVAILGNLLDNAIDAAADAPAPRLVELSVETTEAALELTVEDSGPGIDPSAVEDIFRHGFSTKKAGPFGRGLGLALVRQAVQRLGGTMTITSPAGALFRVTLPVTTPPVTTCRPQTCPSQQRNNHERDPGARRRRRAHCRRGARRLRRRLDGFTLAGSAPDGQSALRLLTEFSAAGNPVELVLLDMNLPDLHGWTSHAGCGRPDSSRTSSPSPRYGN